MYVSWNRNKTVPFGASISTEPLWSSELAGWSKVPTVFTLQHWVGKERLYTTDHKHSLKLPYLMNNKPPLTWRSIFCAANQGKISVFGKPSNLSHQASKTLFFFLMVTLTFIIWLCMYYHTYREGLSSLLNHKALDNMSENLWFDDSLGNRCSVFVPVPYSWQWERQRKRGRRWEGSFWRRSWWIMKKKK